MCIETVEVARYRPAIYDSAIAIGERKPLYVGLPSHYYSHSYPTGNAEIFAEAKKLAQARLDAEPPVVIGGQVYPPTIIVPAWRH